MSRLNLLSLNCGHRCCWEKKNPICCLEIEDITLSKQDCEAGVGLVRWGTRWIQGTEAVSGGGISKTLGIVAVEGATAQGPLGCTDVLWTTGGCFCELASYSPQGPCPVCPFHIT